MFNFKKLGVAALFSLAAVASSQASAAGIFDGGIPAGWSCNGDCGTSGANGVVPLAPSGGSQYGYVSSYQGVNGVALPGVGGAGSGTNGSTLRSNAFTANAGDALVFNFDYVTSDGAGYADYAWARLLDSSLNQVALLFTARTSPSGDIVPGFSMPSPAATLNPTSVTITPGTTWAPLGGTSGGCYSAGCGNTGWIQSSFTVANAGSYVLEFGVTNWIDTAYDSGLAVDGITIADHPITNVPEPATLALLALGMLGFAASRRKA